MNRSNHPHRHLPPVDIGPTLYLLDPTPDGFAEVTAEVRGREVARTVLHDGMGWDDCAAVLAGLMADVMRRC